MANKVVDEKVYVHPDDLLMLGDSEDSAKLKEIKASNLLAGESNVPSYSALVTYPKDATAISGAGFLIRSLQAGNLGNTPPTYNAIDTAWWQNVTPRLNGHSDTQDLANVPIRHAGTIIMPNGNVTTTEPLVGFAVGKYMEPLKYLKFHSASTAYVTNQVIIGADGLMYQLGKTTNADLTAAFSIGWQDNQWHLLGQSARGQKAFLTISSASITGSWTSLDCGAVLTQSDDMGVSVGTGGSAGSLILNNIGEYIVEFAVKYPWGSGGDWFEGVIPTSYAGCTITVLNSGYAAASDYVGGHVTGTPITRYHVDVTAIGATLKPKYQRNNSGAVSPDVSHSFISVERIK